MSYKEALRRWATGLRCCILAGVLALPLAVPLQAGAEELKMGGTGSAHGTMRLLANEFLLKYPQVTIKMVPNLGSGGGIKAVLSGAIDLALSSRPLTAGELQQGAAAIEYGRTPLVFVVGTKTPVDTISREELTEIYAGTKVKWPDGSLIRVVLRPPNDIDADMVKNLSPQMRRAVALAEARPGVRVAQTDQITADDLERIPGAVGASSLSVIASEKRALKVLPLDGRQPLLNNAVNPAYPHVKRMLFVIGLKRSAAAEEFMSFVDSPAGRKILIANGHWLP